MLKSFLFLATPFAVANGLGIIQNYLNQPIEGGEFTFYGASGKGACGLDVSTYSAAVSGNLFDPSATWVPSTLPDGRYILNDPVCNGICVKITYKGQTAVFSADNKCPECAVDHVDLSEPAFLCLEPLGGTVGIATPATIEYLFCNQTTVNTDCSGLSTGATSAPAPSTAAPAPSTAAPALSTAAPTPSSGSGSPTPSPSSPPSSSGDVSLTVKTTSSWADGAQFDVLITNNRATPVCGATVQITKDATTSFVSMWNLESSDGVNYTTPSWLNLAQGQSLDAGVVTSGTSIPTFTLVSTNTC